MVFFILESIDSLNRNQKILLIILTIYRPEILMMVDWDP